MTLLHRFHQASSSKELHKKAHRSRQYWHALWLLTVRDLRVRYSTSALGYLWSILDPLAMSAIYWFVFTQVFDREVAGEYPYILFLLSALLPWAWFTGSVSDATRALTKEAKLIRSTTIPRSVWIARVSASKGIEFLLSMPVLVLFTVTTGARVHWELGLYPLALILQAALVYGIGLIVAPLVVFFRDLERAIKLILRFLFYSTPIVYGTQSLPHSLQHLAALNPMTGVISLYRATFFPNQLIWRDVAASFAITVTILVIGELLFRRCERRVLKEL